MCVYVCMCFKMMKLFQVFAISRLFLSTLELQLHLNLKPFWNTEDKFWRLKSLTGYWRLGLVLTFKVASLFCRNVCAYLECHRLPLGWHLLDFMVSRASSRSAIVIFTLYPNIPFMIWKELVESNVFLFSVYFDHLILFEF